MIMAAGVSDNSSIGTSDAATGDRGSLATAMVFAVAARAVRGESIASTGRLTVV
jgi:hypothetical protein